MCGTFEYGLNAAAKEFDGKNKYIRITDIDDASREFLLSDLSSPDICLDGMSKYILSSGDIVFARTGASVGKTYIYRENDGIVYFAGFLIRAKVNQDNDAEFVFQSTLSPSYEKYIRITSQRSGQPGVNAQEYGEYDLFAPSKEEQQRIGHFLRGIDNLITLHQKKCLEWKKKDFTSASISWEQREFGDYNDLMTGYPFESDKFSEDGIKLVRGMNVKRGYLDFSEDICMRWNSCVGLENFLLKAGDILIQMDGALIGKSYAKIKENQLPALLVQRVTRSRTNNKFASQDFMYQTIQRDFLRYIEMSKTETAVPHLSLNDIRNFEIMVPCLVEQEKIGAYFSAFDRLITLHQRKLELLKRLRNSLVDRCFIGEKCTMSKLIL